jgi:hypothetical protein
MTPDGKRRFAFGLIAAALCVFATNTGAQNSSRSDGWIAIPAAEYQSLRDKAFPIEPEPEPSPVQATLTRISYDLRVNGDLALGRAELTVDVIEAGWVRIPVPSNLLVREATLDGKPVSLVGGDKDPFSKSAVFSYKGRAVLQLDIVLPILTDASGESISLPPAPAGITRASVRLPRQGVEVKLTGGFLAEKSASASESRWLAYGQGGIGPLVFAWSRKTEDLRSSQPLRLRGTLTELVGLGEDTTTVQAEINAEVLQGAAHEMKIQLPDKVTINQVAGAMVADWEMEPGELRVTFLEPVGKTARFLLTGETRTPREGKIDIPLLRIPDAERETGGVAVEVLGAGEITDRKMMGLEDADAADLGEIVSMRQSPSIVAFRFQSGDGKAPRSLSVEIARYTQEAVLLANIEEARYRVLMSDEGKSLVQARYAIRNNQRNFLKIKLPLDAVVWSASLSGKPIRPGQAPDGSLLLPLEKARAGEEASAFAAEVLYFNRSERWKDDGRLQLVLPMLDLPVSRSGVQCFYPPLYSITPEPGSFRIEDFQNPASEALNRDRTFASGSVSGIGSGLNNSLPLTSNDVMDLVKVQGGVQPAEKDKDAQTLVDAYNAQSRGGKRAGILPINLSFPEFGPSIFLVSELTAENQSPAIDIGYKAEKQRGAK